MDAADCRLTVFERGAEAGKAADSAPVYRSSTLLKVFSRSCNVDAVVDDLHLQYKAGLGWAAQNQPQRDSLLIALPQVIEQDSRIAAVLR